MTKNVDKQRLLDFLKESTNPIEDLIERLESGDFDTRGPRLLGKDIARLLTHAVAGYNGDWFRPSLVMVRHKIGRSATQAKHWGLLEKASKADFEKPSGWWRVTALGDEWARGRVRLWRELVTANDVVVGTVVERGRVSVSEALEDPDFDLQAFIEHYYAPRVVVDASLSV